jgi:tryptophanyl-tRNA synthetase
MQGWDSVMIKSDVEIGGTDQLFNLLVGRELQEKEGQPPQICLTFPLINGLDGRKMSKSYDNTIPLFAPREQLKKLILSIVTDSRAPGEPKDTEGSALFQLYQAFASADETAAMRDAYAGGIGWGDAKQQLFERIDREIAPLRERYEALMAKPAEIEAQLRDGARTARERLGTPFMQQLREAVGLRDLSTMPAATNALKEKAASVPVLKQYREPDGRFHFKLADGDAVLLQSHGFDNPKDAGAWVARLKGEGAAALDAVADVVEPWAAEARDAIAEALDALKHAEDARQQAKAR